MQKKTLNIRTEIYQDIDDSYCVELYSSDNKRMAYGRLVLMHQSEYMDHLKKFKTEPIFKKITNIDHIVYLEEIEVEYEFRQQGLGRKILDSLMKIYYETYPELHIFLNATPLGRDKIPLTNLIDFYQEAGFQVIQNEGFSAYMWKASDRRPPSFF